MRGYIGIDWSQDKHDVAFVNQAGSLLAHLTISHSPQGFLSIEATRQQLGLAREECVVGLETAHNLIIDFLWSQGYTEVYVIPPHVVKSNRGRFSHSGAHTDRTDAMLIDEILRTDSQPRHPWHPGSLLYRQIRAQVSFILHLGRQEVRLANRLRSVLQRYYPAALAIFGHLRCQIALHFICAYPTPQAAASLSYQELVAFAQAHHYSHPDKLLEYAACLQGPYPHPLPETVATYEMEAVQLASLLLPIMQARQAQLRLLQARFRQHPDAFIFASLPGAGDFLAPALLAKVGEERARFPTPQSLQALAGTCPVTKRSGKRKVVRFRKACDREFRHIVQQWARASLSQSIWAMAYWKQIRPHCRSNSHALRCLANRWLAVLWKLWQSRQPYDEAYHLHQRALRSQLRD